MCAEATIPTAVTSTHPPASAPNSAAEAERVCEAELVRKAIAGEAAAAREIVHRYHRRIYSFIHHMTHQVQDAEDITQETFIKAFRALHRYDPSRPLINWLFTIARRTALNHLRTVRKWTAIPDELPSGDKSPAEQTEAQNRIEDVWGSARRQLSPRAYQVLWLRFGEDLSTGETARVMGLTTVHVKVLLYRARRLLSEGKETL